MVQPQLVRDVVPASGPAPSSRAAAPHYDLAWFRYLLFGRAIPTVVFGCAAWLALSSRVVPAVTEAIDHPSYGNIARAVQLCVYVVFAVLPAVIYLSRPAPRANDASIPARVAAFAAVGFMIVLPAFGLPSGPVLYQSEALGATLGAGLTVAAWIFGIAAVLHLRHNLSVTPEARTLVTSGPYRRVRHPLYLAEIVAAVGGVLGGMRLQALAAVALLVVLQLVRAHYEERLLRRVFPEYGTYAARTRRIVPGVW